MPSNLSKSGRWATVAACTTLSAAGLSAQQAPAAPRPGSAADWLTRAERTDFRETSSHADVVAFVERAASADARMHLTTFGYTVEGRPLPLLVVGDVTAASPEAVRAAGKTVVYLQGNIHAGEVCGKEALQMLVREIAMGEHDAWFESMVLLIAPIYNADGNERIALTNRPRQHGPVGGMGQRPNADGLDLNRDHMKLDSPEARSVARLFTDYDPHVAVDLHTTNGSRHAYHLTYSPPLHPNTPAVIDRWLRDDLFPRVTERVRERHGWEYYYYGNLVEREGMERGWYTFDHRPRFNNNYIGLRNRIAILSEAYSYATFENRVLGTLYFVQEILDAVRDDADRVREIVAEADAALNVGDSLAVRASIARTAERVEILMGEVAEERHPLTGEVMLRRTGASRPDAMYEFGHFEGTAFERVPAGYLIPPRLEQVLVRLAAHGVEFEPAPTRAYDVEVFRIESVETAGRPFQGRHEQRLEGRWEPGTRTPAAGWMWASADQPLGRLLFSLLEPRSDDGFAAWELLADHLEPGGEYPILRVPASSP